MQTPLEGELSKVDTKIQIPIFNFSPKHMYVQNVSESVALVDWYPEQEGGAEGRRSAVLKKTEGVWKIIHFHADRFKLG